MDQPEPEAEQQSERDERTERELFSRFPILMNVLESLSEEIKSLKKENHTIRQVLRAHGILLTDPNAETGTDLVAIANQPGCSKTLMNNNNENDAPSLSRPSNPLFVVEIVDLIYSYLSKDAKSLRNCRRVCKLWNDTFETQRNIRRMMSVGTANTLRLTTSFIDVYEFAELMANPASTDSFAGIDVVLPVLNYALSTPFSNWIDKKGDKVFHLDLACDKHKPLMVDTFIVRVLHYFCNIESLTICQLVLKNVGFPVEGKLLNLKRITICDQGRGTSLPLWKRLLCLAPNLTEISIMQHKIAVDLPYTINGSRKTTADLIRECLSGPDKKVLENIELLNLEIDITVIPSLAEGDLHKLKRIKIVRSDTDPVHLLTRLEIAALTRIMVAVADTLEEFCFKGSGSAFHPNRVNSSDIPFPKMSRLLRYECNLSSIKCLEKFPVLKMCGLGVNSFEVLLPSDLGTFQHQNVVEVTTHAVINGDSINLFPRLLSCFPNLQILTIRVGESGILPKVFESFNEVRIKLKELTLEIHEFVMDEGILITCMPMVLDLWHLTLKMVVPNSLVRIQNGHRETCSLGAFHPLSLPSVRDGLCKAPALRSLELNSFEILQIQKDDILYCLSKKLNRVKFENCRIMCGGSDFSSYDEDISYIFTLPSNELVLYRSP